MARVKPLVSVLTLLSLSQIGLVTYLATRDFVDLISGKSAIAGVLSYWVVIASNLGPLLSETDPSVSGRVE